MEIKEVIGIDASKLTLDCCAHTNGAQEVFDNSLEAIATMVDWSLKTSGSAREDLLFVFEHTGLYTHELIEYLSEHDYLFHVVPFQVPSGSLARAKRLTSMRRKLVAQRGGHIATLGEQKRVLKPGQGALLFEVQQQIISVLDVQIAKLEKELAHIIGKDPELEKLYRLLTSIKGIGPVTARFLIIHTDGFKAFKTWRKFASYCGIAPFPNRSGTTIRGRTKVSHLANKDGKTLLNLCATTSIQHNPEMKQFYQRRLEIGKSKMSTLNIIRNKLPARAFAVVKRGTPYVDTMKYAA